MTNSEQLLIDKLRAEKLGYCDPSPASRYYQRGLDKAIDLARQHTTAKGDDRMAHELNLERIAHDCTKAKLEATEEAYEAVIAAMCKASVQTGTNCTDSQDKLLNRGDAAIRKDAGDTAKATLITSPAISREICDNEAKNNSYLVMKMVEACSGLEDLEDCMLAALVAIRPYLATREPVMKGDSNE